ncbi:MAG: UDP-3-O-(3-hydroxymyristoyl)glucosamine N-acyltransferase, partial [Opitutae bacterium]|nr:UDP-3-O-(3-hydroxymyristoyl)glucosamine N-acyltransferase [Opitutae bacterium]
MNHPKIITAGVRDVTFGSNVTVVEPCNLYECEIGDDVFVGPFVEIQRGVLIGARSRIQSHSFVCEKVIIGEDCFIGHGVTFINDTFRSGKISFDPTDWKETKVGDGAIIGSNATVMPVQIAAGVVVGAGSVV